MPPLRLKYWRRRTARFACSYLFIIEFTIQGRSVKDSHCAIAHTAILPLLVVVAIVFDDPITTPHSQKVHRFTRKTTVVA